MHKLFPGATGFLCGKGYSIAKANPETVLPIVKLSAASGVAGVLLGWGISAYRNLPTHIYALSLGSNFAITSGVFFSEQRQVASAVLLRDHTPCALIKHEVVVCVVVTLCMGLAWKILVMFSLAK